MGGKLKLNLGCGKRRREGFLNVDSQPGCHPDLVLDLEKLPWPWPDDSVDEVDLIHVLEHLGQSPAVYLGIMKELWRVCCDGAKVRIVVPHPRSDEYLNDPTHVRPVTEAGLEMFCQRANAEWESAGAANTPLGFYLGIDFEIDSLAIDLKTRWLERLQRGEVSEAEVRMASESQFNVIAQSTVMLRAVKPAGRLLVQQANADSATPGDAPSAEPAWVRERDAALAEGDGARAKEVLTAALAVNPEDHEVRAHLASVHHALGELAEAYEHYRRVAEAGIGGFELYNNFGVVALELGRTAEAVAAFSKALEFDPEQRTVRANLAEALGADGRVKDAIAYYEALIREAPEDPATYVGLTKLFISQGWFADAMQAVDMARQFGFDDAEVLNQRGIVCRELGRYQEALDCFEAALAKDPGNVFLVLNQANALARMNRDEEAEALYKSALAAVGDYCPHELGFAYACFLLKRGRTVEGWEFYEARRAAPTVVHHPLEQSVPQWRGEEGTEGGSLLITAEQGFGDNIQFLRLIPKLVGRFSRICLQTRPALLKLFARSLEGYCEVVEQVAEDAVFDWICPIASLPLAIDLPVRAWGMSEPYLKVDSMPAALWGFRIPAGRQKKIGLCWNGGKSARYRHRCDLPLTEVERLLAQPGPRWVSLQKDADEAWRRAQVQAGKLVDLMEMVGNFDDTAALVSNLDLIITVDTSVAHIAGALGKPVWLLIAYDADWRWLDGREDSPWYPSMRIFRQQTPENWKDLASRVLRELASVV